MTDAAKPPSVQFTLPEAYPQMVDRQDVARILHLLRSDKTMAKARDAMEAAAPSMKRAIAEYAADMEAAGGDQAEIFAKAHEIRGFAENAGMVSTGRIADVLCRYMDDMERIGRPADAAIVALHVSAIARAAVAEEEDARMGEIVAAELATLVTRKLLEAQNKP